MIKRFRTRPVEIDALQFTGKNFAEMFEWTEGNFRKIVKTKESESHGHVVPYEVTVFQVYDKLHTTWINVESGQWIVRGAKQEFYPCDDETFFWKYEEIE